MPVFKNIAGTSYGRLTVIKLLEKYPKRDGKGNKTVWLCRCSCGEFVSATQGSLHTGDKKSCGCLTRERLIGASNKYLYSTWSGIRNRCRNKNTINFKDYGAKGVVMHDEWHDDFQKFKSYILENLGHRPTSGHSIDRIENSEGYSPGNLRWATRLQQNNNASRNINIEYEGVTRTLSEWCVHLGIRYGKAYERIKKLGWSPLKALGLPEA